MHTRHPTEQTVTDEKLEKNYFRHRYVRVDNNLLTQCVSLCQKSIVNVNIFYIISTRVIVDYNVQIKKVLVVESGQQHSD